MGRCKGLKILSRRVTVCLDRRGNLPSLSGVKPIASLFLFVALCFHIASFVYPANRVVTPKSHPSLGQKEGESFTLIWTGEGVGSDRWVSPWSKYFKMEK